MATQLHRDLQRFLHHRLTNEDAKAAIRRRLRQRERSFLRLMKHAVYANPRSPYRMLLRHIGITFQDLTRSVVSEGVEATLARLYDAGIHVSVEEFKGRRPILRSGLEVSTKPHDFDNPLITGHLEGRTSGSKGPTIPVRVDLRMVAHEAAFVHGFLEGFGLRELPVACWRGVPPIASGLRGILMYAKVGIRIERWFAQNKPSELPEHAASTKFTRDLLDAVRSLGWSVPEPQYIHQDKSVSIAQWLANCRGAGRPAQLDTNSSSGVRVCLAALDHRLDISGSFFRLGGEPYTEAKAAIIDRAGCRAACHYSITEGGQSGSLARRPITWTRCIF